MRLSSHLLIYRKDVKYYMAEALLGRGIPKIPEDVLDPIPVTSTTHGIKVTLKDPGGKIMANYPIQCKDGTATYNYTTNEKGQTIFSVNSGAANIFVNNYNGSYQILDISSKWTNIDAPVGMTTRVNINLSNLTNTSYNFTTNKLFEIYFKRNCNLYIVGGGGGGTTCWDWSSGKWNGGGAGYMNTYTNQSLQGQYNFIRGIGGNGSWYNMNNSSQCRDSGNGGTSYIVETDYYAIGGGSGKSGGKGGLGYGGNSSNINGQPSNVTFAGGGGAAAEGSYGSVTLGNRGTPYGGNAAYGASTTAATRAGGGGVSATPGHGGRQYKAGDGGPGVMRIDIFY